MVRRLIGYVLKLALVWCIWWGVVAIGAQTYWSQVRERFREAGWTAEGSITDLTGFPGSFDFTLEGMNLSSQRTPFGWQGGSLRLIARAWNPLHITVIPEARQTLVTSAGRFNLEAEAAELTGALAPGLALTFTGVKADLTQAVLASSRGWRMTLGEGRLSVWAAEGEHSYDLIADITDFTPALWQRRQIDPSGRLPVSMERLTLDATMRFDTAWDRYAFDGTTNPEPTAIEIRRFELLWGDVGIEVTGSVTISAEGIPTGSGRVSTSNWPELLALAEAGGQLSAEDAEKLRGTLSSLASKSDPNALSVPIYFAAGLMAVGLVPIGPAPVIRLH